MSKYYTPKYKQRVYCTGCRLNYEKSECPLYTTTTGAFTYPTCPKCSGNLRIRTIVKHKKWRKDLYVSY